MKLTVPTMLTLLGILLGLSVVTNVLVLANETVVGTHVQVRSGDRG